MCRWVLWRIVNPQQNPITFATVDLRPHRGIRVVCAASASSLCSIVLCALFESFVSPISVAWWWCCCGRRYLWSTHNLTFQDRDATERRFTNTQKPRRICREREKAGERDDPKNIGICIISIGLSNAEGVLWDGFLREPDRTVCWSILPKMCCCIGSRATLVLISVWAIVSWWWEELAYSEVD